MIDFNKESETLNAVLFSSDFDDTEEGFSSYVKQLFIRCDVGELDRAYRLSKSKIESICPNPFEIPLPEQSSREKRFNLDNSIDTLFKYEKERRQEQRNKEEPGKATKDKLTHKQQILLLKQVGFFELDIFQKLTTQQKGKLVSHLLNRTEKDSLELIRGMNGKPKEPFILKTKGNIETINKLLSDIDLSEHLVK